MKLICILIFAVFCMVGMAATVQSICDYFKK